MNKKTRILILEDLLTEAELVMAELRQAKLSFESKRVDNKLAFLKALKEFAPDIIISDYELPQFTALDALRILKVVKLKTPFIIYTNPLSDNIAVQCMKLGAAEYIPKSNLGKLSSAVLDVMMENQSRLAEEKSVAALRESEYKLRTLLGSMSEALLQVNNNEVIEFINDRFCEMTGYKREELLGQVTFDLLFDQDACKPVNESNGKNDKAGSNRYELCLKKKTGETLWTIVSGTPIINEDGVVTGSMRVFTDITERKIAEEQLMHDALHDALTGLANRTLFMHHLRMTIERGKRNKQNLFAVLFLDFDRFKVINDSLGHAEGDKLLKYIARRLEVCTRTVDLVARLGGDEFVILLGELNETAEALLVAERILSDLKSSFDLGGSEVFISTSIGITLSTSGHTKAEDMLRDADIAMYRAKANGKAQYQVFDQEMHQQAVMQLQFETDMRHALERGEFCLHYQPIVNLETQKLVGFEALVRWKHPERGMVSPMVFIPTAEENRMILPLGKWILNESCRQLKEWQDENPAAEHLMISVNLSCKQFLQPDLVEQVASALRETGLNPGCLKLEITESYIMENTEAAVATMNRLRSLGIEISLDDFGTGYSSLSYLHRLPIDYLKIDRSFVSNMGESKENSEIVYTIIKLAQNLKMKVIAEGIETDEQLAQLHLLNCEYGQGFYFSKPLEAEKTKIFINETFEKLPDMANHPMTSLEMNLEQQAIGS
jgi:diguanylate cyclase (GGDEF)-like protein/PAS domain S-box-containing protein